MKEWKQAPGVREGEQEEGRAWRREMKKGRKVRGEHGVRDGVGEGGREGSEGINEGGEAGRREHAWSDRWRE